jgi:hypothetical protein
MRIEQLLERRNHFGAVAMTVRDQSDANPLPSPRLVDCKDGFPSRVHDGFMARCILFGFPDLWGPWSAAESCLMTSDAVMSLASLLVAASSPNLP